jgi:tetratricopeptide (TPR) repeat protein
MTSLRHRALVTVLLALIPSMVLAQSQSKMAGTVKDADGNPAPNVRVRLQATDAEGAAVETKSKKDGKYLIGMVRPGQYTLDVVSDNGKVLIHLKGKAVDGTDRQHVFWELDQDVGEKMPTFKVGSVNQISLDLTVGSTKPSVAAASMSQAESRAAYDDAMQKIGSGDFNGALAKLEPLLAAEPDHVQLNYLVAFADHGIGKHDEALTLIDKVIAKDPNYSGAQVLRGKILQAQDKNADAEAAFRLELEHSTNKTVRLESWAALAVVLDKTGQKAAAIETLEKAVAEQPTRELYLALSDFYAKAGNREKAAATLERAEKEAGGMDDGALLNLAISYINDKKYDDAEKLARRVVDKESTDPNKSLAHSILARCELSRGRTQPGIEHLEKALALDPNSSLTAENKEILAALKKK